ncbi:MAG: hypothetical protein K2X93_05975 [Candidatus Obscuribacterales bacterium]|nr:hypothetical protein [Candidatus Obscuribacterales bacterium]
MFDLAFYKCERFEQVAYALKAMLFAFLQTLEYDLGELVLCLRVAGNWLRRLTATGSIFGSPL